uniref:Staphylococcal nuclease domain-containing protein 1 n=2 Tax=Lutzomyia longipalpis TaxID=7200 RepID=A0A1B0GKL7_LUTLO
MSANPPQLKWGIVKQVLSGDSVIIRGQPQGGPPPEKQINFSNVLAPKLARRPGGGAINSSGEDNRDEPWAWEAREFLRKKLIGEEVYFTCERPQKSTRDYGVVYLGKDPATAQNITELIVAEGLVTVRRESSHNSAEIAKLVELEDAAKAAGKGKWSNAQPSEHVRNIKWTQDNPRNFVEHYHGKPIKAIIEHVRDGSTIRAFLLPEFNYITLIISGIRCPGFKLDSEGKPDPSVTVPYAEEARYFVESRLLQRDVEIILESVNNANFVGSILFPKGNIAEALLREGFAKCVDWSMAFMKSGAEKLRAAEKQAKEKRLRLWKDYQSNVQNFSGKEKDFYGTVVEVFNGDALSVRSTSGAVKKVFLASIRPPREAARPVGEDGKVAPRSKNRPLYEIPWMFEARENLRKLIGKKVHCVLDYISPARDNFPEKYCYTVTLGKTNIAEALVAEGLATVVRYRQDDDQRSSQYDGLLSAEAQASKAGKARPAANGVPAQEGEPFGDEALNFTRERILQRDVSVHIESTDKAGTSVIGWLWTDNNVNLSVALVEEGLATVHFTAEKSEYYRALKNAEDQAKAKKKNIWKNYTAEVENEKERDGETEEKDEDKSVDRKVNHEKVVITEVTPELHFFAQHAEQGTKLEALMAKLRQDFNISPPITGSYTPKRGDLCAAKFTEDNDWYRAKVERIMKSNVSVTYIDYGNKEVLPTSRLAMLPPAFTMDKPYATEFGLALCQLPPDDEDKQEAYKTFVEDVRNRQLLLNVEYKVEEYKEAEVAAKKAHNGIWEYGDITEDDAKEFGVGR